MFLAQVLGGLLKDKVKVPEFQEVNAQTEQNKVVSGNLAALPEIENLASQLNQFNQDELNKAFADIFPGYKDAARQAGSNIEDLLSGRISDSTASEISRRSAARSIGSTGSFGPRGRSLEARDFGTTIEAQKSAGLSALSGWLASAKGSLIAPQFDVTSMFLTPQQQISHSVSERDKKFQRDFGSNQLKAAQGTGTIVGNALIDTDNQMMSMASSLVGSFMGGGGGGGAQAKSSGFNPAATGSPQFQAPMATGAYGGGQSYGGSLYSPMSYGAQVNVPAANYYSGSVNPYSSVPNYWGGN